MRRSFSRKVNYGCEEIYGPVCFHEFFYETSTSFSTTNCQELFDSLNIVFKIEEVETWESEKTLEKRPPF